MSADLEEQIAQLENSLGQEQQRLEKLWDAYEQQQSGMIHLRADGKLISHQH